MKIKRWKYPAFSPAFLPVPSRPGQGSTQRHEEGGRRGQSFSTRISLLLPALPRLTDQWDTRTTRGLQTLPALRSQLWFLPPGRRAPRPWQLQWHRAGEALEISEEPLGHQQEAGLGQDCCRSDVIRGEMRSTCDSAGLSLGEHHCFPSPGKRLMAQMYV